MLVQVTCRKHCVLQIVLSTCRVVMSAFVRLPRSDHPMRVCRGHYAAARALLHRARAHAHACDHPEAAARALLVEARWVAGTGSGFGSIIAWVMPALGDSRGVLALDKGYEWHSLLSASGGAP